MGEFKNLTGNKCKIVETKKVKQGKRKFVNEITCEITHGITSKNGLRFTTSETMFKRDWKPIKET